MKFNLKKTLISGAIVLAYANIALGQTSDVIKIGYAGPKSGNIAHLGIDCENGAKMAIYELNAKQVSIGGKVVQFELISEDDGNDPKQSVAVANRLVNAKVSGVIGHLTSTCSVLASPVYNEAGIPQISPSTTNPKFTQQGYNTVFRLVATDSLIGGTLGRYAVSVLKAKKIAVIDDGTEYGKGIAEEFIKGVISKKVVGVEIVSTQNTNSAATDFNEILTEIKSKNPDLIFFGGMDAVAGPMLKQMKQLGIKAKFVGGDGICSNTLLKLAGDAMADDQVTCVLSGVIEEAGKKAMDDFEAAYLKKYNARVENYAAYAYTAVMVLVEAMKNANSSDPAKYLPFLAKINFKSVIGIVAFDNKGDIKGPRLTLYTFKAGKRVLFTVTK